jgi:hypothetical protein
LKPVEWRVGGLGRRVAGAQDARLEMETEGRAPGGGGRRAGAPAA